MEYQLIYYPKCSTCVKGLALLNENGINPELITYMSDKLNAEQIKEIAKKVGNIRAIIREKTAKELGISLEQSDDALYEIIAKNLALLQRPILIKNDKAIVGRPIEEMLLLK
jgi:arsenate reductase (glutaredoxin)